MVSVEQLIVALTFVAALGCGLVAGIFLAFSTFVMKALARLPAHEGIAAMQSINDVVVRSGFMAVFMGTAVACAVAIVASVTRWHEPGATYLLAGGVLYLIGCFLATIVFNVPRNNALASVVPTGSSAGGVWAGYVASWTAWNHVRTAASLAAAVSFSVALRYC